MAPRIATVSDIEAVLERLYPTAGRGTGAAEAAAPEAHDPHRDVERLKDLASDAPVIRLVNQLIARAVEMRASDIHIEPREHGLAIRYRIDGVLHDMEAPPATLGAGARLAPQDHGAARHRRAPPAAGRAHPHRRARPRDRPARLDRADASTARSVVLRVLDRSSVELDFAKLGFDDGARRRASCSCSTAPNGILLVTGPTGSGKTTTLYASLKHAQPAGQARSSPSRTRSNTSSSGINQIAGQAADRPELRATCCARSCARIPTSSWSARSATSRRRRSRSRRR